MDSYLRLVDYNFETTTFPISGELAQILQSDFIESNDCITLKGISNNNRNPAFETDREKCEWEYNETHFHPDSYVIANRENEIEYLKAALESGKRLAFRLKEIYPHQHFRILISFSETNYQSREIESYGSSTVRFYQIRPEAEIVFRIEDLNSYKSDAVMEIEV